MLNQVIMVGRLTETPKCEEGKAVITLAVPRNFKNENGEYDTDFISCTLINGVAQNTCEYCHKGDIVGVKGRMECLDGNLKISVEKVTFLTSKKQED